MADSVDSIKGKIRDYMENNFMIVGGDKINDEDSFLEKGVVDSTGILEVVGFIQAEFNIVVADDEMLPENLDSISNIAKYIVRKMAS